MKLLNELICAVWGCNKKINFMKILDRQNATSTWFCSRCKTRTDRYYRLSNYWPSDKEAEETIKRVEGNNAKMHKKYGYDFKY